VRLDAGAARLLLGAALAVLATGAPRAEDEHRALAGFVRAPAAAVRGEPVQAREWERRLRAADRFGPPPLRAVDAELLAAARESRWADVARLVKTQGAGVNARDDIHGHALVWLARAGQDELLREFLQRGAERDRVGADGFTALGAAAFAGRRSTVRLLVRAGADPERWGASGQGPLHLASVAGQLEVIDELLRLRVDVDGLNRLRETALDVAAAAGQQDAMDRLLAAGADPLDAGRR
jgi:uncharacterized protein